MNNINAWLTKEEQSVTVSRSARRKLSRALFPVFAWRSRIRYALAGLTVAAGLFALTSVISPTHSPLSAETVFAEAMNNMTSGSQDMLSVVRKTSTSNQGRGVRTQEVISDGDHFLVIWKDTYSDETSVLRSWKERNGDNLTMTSYAYSDGYFIRELEGDYYYYSQAQEQGVSIGSWSGVPSINLAEVSPEMTTLTLGDCVENCDVLLPTNLFFGAEDGVELSEKTLDGHNYYVINVTRNDFASSASVAPKMFLTYWIDKATMQLAIMDTYRSLDDGSLWKDQAIFTYDTIRAEDLDMDFSLEGWMQLMTSEKKPITCYAYGLDCQDASTPSWHHADFYFPEGWLNDPRLDGYPVIADPQLQS